MWRYREMDGGSDPECTAFDAACQEIMGLVGLTCGFLECYMSSEAQGLPWCPQFPPRLSGIEP
jgi:hypothetical protein